MSKKETIIVQGTVKQCLLALIFVLVAIQLSAQQNYYQTIRGVVYEKNSQERLVGVNVLVMSGGKQSGDTTNEKGEFAVENVPVGRCNIAVSMLGFTPYLSNNILVFSGKETVLEVALEENINELEEVVVTAKVDKEQPLNRMAVVSARLLSSEEANRYAGSWGDPARMVAGMAGVASADDSRNDIVIRGNSPSGLQWRLDGFEIPNPNHFGSMGGTGGAIGMLNNNQLANSDFYTGAFPAEFGNLTSGLFDLRLRNGNNQRHEFLSSVGFNGFELGAEGPLSKKTGASYLINGRYSFLSLLGEMGVDFGTDGAIPEYQDVSAKINFPLKKGNLSLISLLGASRIHSQSDFEDESGWIDGDMGNDMTMSNQQVFAGVNYTHRFTASTRLENRLSYQHFQQLLTNDQIVYPTEARLDYFNGKSKEGIIGYSSNLYHRMSSKSSVKSGIGADIYMTDLRNVSENVVLHDYTGNSSLLKAFTQWQYRFNDAISITPGVYGQYYTHNNDYSIEPRIGIKWDVSPRASLSFGSGLFSQLQPRQVYFYEEEGIEKNKNLHMSKSLQYVLGYNQKLGVGMHLKTEVFYQHLFNIPVIPDTPEESILNFGDDYYNNWDYSFVNEGTGRNYGVEMTLEKFFDNSYYFLITGSLYDSKYKGYDRIERHSKFAGNYAVNGLFGYEWKIGAKHLLSANVKATCMGGKRVLPTSMIVGGDWSSDYTQAYAQHLPDYFRIDLNINMKHNHKRCSVEWFLEVDNLTNHQNVWLKYYSENRHKDEYVYQYSLMPMGGCKIYFNTKK